MNAQLGIYLVTDTAQCGRRGVIETVQQAVDGGVRTVPTRPMAVPPARPGLRVVRDGD